MTVLFIGEKQQDFCGIVSVCRTDWVTAVATESKKKHQHTLSLLVSSVPLREGLFRLPQSNYLA